MSHNFNNSEDFIMKYFLATIMSTLFLLGLIACDNEGCTTDLADVTVVTSESDAVGNTDSESEASVEDASTDSVGDALPENEVASDATADDTAAEEEEASDAETSE